MIILTSSAAEDWSRFRGPNGSGIATADAHPPLTWSDSQNLKWKTSLPGSGTSSPILVAGRVFVTCWTGDSATLKRQLVCVDQKSGKILWSRSVNGEPRVDRYDGYLQEHGYASHTPASDGERVYVYFGKGGALAFDLEGKQLWHVNLGTDANAKNWGSASSPVLHKDTVIINASEESHAIYALDKKTGKQIWKAEGGSLEYAFGTPIITEHDGRADLVISVPNELWGLNPDNGKLRWYAMTGLPGNIAPSVVSADGVVFAFGGFPRTAAVAVKLGGKDDVTQSHLLWTSNNSSYVPTPVVHQGGLHFVNDQGFALCMNAKTGDLIYKERVSADGPIGRGGKPFYASPVLANGHYYAVSRRNGVFVVAAQPQFKLVAHNTFSSDSTQFNATPAISGNQIFLRSDRYLYCVSSEAKN
ncbi:MAG: PQQ-binding-like beta-propeller repeat protein [Verrucomicrobiota bacterium]